MKVAVFGASGFVGATLVERLVTRDDITIKAFIHSFGNAWRLARACVPMNTIDITSPRQVSDAIIGCTHVVNCTRGSSEVMIHGLKTLLEASRVNKVRRFVHLSSVAVYGDPPPLDSEDEAAPALPPPGSYGEEKLRQDDLVAAAVSAGLDCVVLCPPNISGPYSSFASNVLADMRNGTFALVDGGDRPLNTVDVGNLVQAIMLALETDHGDGRRIFITDGVGLTWKNLCNALLPIAELEVPIRTISATGLVHPETPGKRPMSLWAGVKHLVSSDVREALRRDPLWAAIDRRMRRLAALGGKRIEDQLRHSIEGSRKIAKVYDTNPLSSRYNLMQMRSVWHKIDRARSVLGYEPELSFAQSMACFQDWYVAMHGFGQPYWPLARLLNDM